MKGEYKTIRLEFTPNQFCVRRIKISHQRKMGVQADCEKKNIHIHFILCDPYFIQESKGAKREKLPFQISLKKFFFFL